ncbi:MAG: hypothetical protein CME61_05525 [Halobacteriovoraceae bacterium]|nr:hypothetical protein [Halobacteriovoraceae bacterium]|tara:strand:- start:241 stop:1506 length:1266 start_codon:yes stop_codon:yes gene_type:complete
MVKDDLSLKKTQSGVLEGVRWAGYKDMLSLYQDEADTNKINCINEVVEAYLKSSENYWEERGVALKCIDRGLSLKNKVSELSKLGCVDEKQSDCCYVSWNFTGINFINLKNKREHKKSLEFASCNPPSEDLGHEDLVDQVASLIEASTESDENPTSLKNILKSCSEARRLPPFDLSAIYSQIEKDSELKFSGKKISEESKEALSLLKELNYSDRQNLEKYCPEFYFQLFMLQLIVNNDINQVPKEGAFALGKIADYPLSDIHKKFFKKKIYEFTRINQCAHPSKTSSTDYLSFSAFAQVLQHPDIIGLDSSVLDHCIRHLDNKVRKYNEWLPVQKCDSFMDYFSSKKGTQLGDLVSKELFCEAYRTNQVVKLLKGKSGKPSYRHSQSLLLESNGPFKENEKPKFKCKYYRYSGKREWCYPN